MSFISSDGSHPFEKLRRVFFFAFCDVTKGKSHDGTGKFSIIITLVFSPSSGQAVAKFQQTAGKI